ncbi:hypothetical protein [Oleiagrimonas sp. C23AA]|uniref:hypothetical protein n=1 Tax=Oleiagrimonas sp. C23AA TaxID=2719047 RepID=UPI00142303E8|nr:hypothetical protein [Oleiagrimonas sp. C23AA]NII10715.1 hypothetical protein [Oleiagrimonas sp. C23AA]
MDWDLFWRLPAMLLLGLAALVLLLALGQGVACHRRWRRRRRLAATSRALLALLALALALLLGGAGVSLRGYRVLSQETPVATLSAKWLAPQHWWVTLTLPDGHSEQIPLDGDAFRLEANVVKWTLPAVLLGHAPQLYRLDRLSGRYDDPRQAAAYPPTVLDLRPTGPDLWTLVRRFPDWVPGVDAVYGSGVYLPLVDGGRYRISLMRTGALVARPANAYTADRLEQRGVTAPDLP